MCENIKALAIILPQKYCSRRNHSNYDTNTKQTNSYSKNMFREHLTFVHSNICLLQGKLFVLKRIYWQLIFQFWYACNTILVKIVVRVGRRKLGLFRIAPVSFVKHPQYNPSTQDYDYAIITLRYVVCFLLFIPCVCRFSHNCIKKSRILSGM